MATSPVVFNEESRVNAFEEYFPGETLGAGHGPIESRDSVCDFTDVENDGNIRRCIGDVGYISRPRNGLQGAADGCSESNQQYNRK